METSEDKSVKKVITYGSFDLFHEGHRRILQRAKALGDYLIVGVTTEYFDESRGKLNVVDPLLTRIQNVKDSGFVDEVIIEDHQGQKLEDIIKYEVDIFTLGSDWEGQFDFLKDYCDVIYLERTKEVSSTKLRGEKYQIIRLGVVGTGRIASRIISETKFVSGIEIEIIYNPNIESAKRFAKKHILNYASSEEEFYSCVDAVYVASPHETHFSYIKKSLERGKHVICEKPMVLKGEEAVELYNLAREKKQVLLEGVKIAYAPGFQQLLGIVRSGTIGNIRDVEAGFTKLVDPRLREMIDTKYGGSFTELGSYALLPILSLFGCKYETIQFESFFAENGVDIYTKAYFKYKHGLATAKTGLGVKSDGQLLISGTKGYIRAKSPWWLMQEFEVCYEDTTQNQVYQTKFLGSGLRYEISEFVSRINGYERKGSKLSEEESIMLARIMEMFLEQREKKNG